jgi:hypothetical protein
MNAITVTRQIRTYVLPVVLMTGAFALVLAYGPELAVGLWDGINATFSALARGVTTTLHGWFTTRPASGLGCWDEIKASLPTETICGDVSGAPADAVNFTGYPTN